MKFRCFTRRRKFCSRRDAAFRSSDAEVFCPYIDLYESGFISLEQNTWFLIQWKRSTRKARKRATKGKRQSAIFKAAHAKS